MKLLKILFSVMFVFGVCSNTYINAHPYEEYDPYQISGVITDYVITMAHERGEHLAYFDLNNGTRWEFANFDDIFELDWEVGDRVIIHGMFANPRSYAVNMDKQKKKSYGVIELRSF